MRYVVILYLLLSLGDVVLDQLEHLESLIEHCRSAETGGYTPSDFPLAGLDQSELDKLISKFGECEN